MSTFIDQLGFHRDRLDQILASLTASAQSIFGSDIDVAPDSPDGQFLGIVSEAISDVIQIAEDTYNGRSPAGAIGAALSRIAQFNGLTRKPAQFSTVTVTLSGTPATVVPAGSLIGSNDPANAVTFATTATLTIGAGGTVTGTALATVSGPLHAPAGTLTKIQSVISGWNAVTNPADATPGTDAESDPALRVRRAASVAFPSQGILDGLFAALDQLDNVTGVAVYENFTDAPIAMKGGGTLAPHAIQAIVDGGDPATIAETIWLRKSMGVTLVGSVTQTITDSQGTVQTMRFDRPVGTNVWITVQLSAPAGSATQDAIINAIVSYGTTNAKIGQDVVWSQLFIPINTVPGLNVLAVFLGSAATPTLQANLVIAFNAIARFDATRINVTS